MQLINLKEKMMSSIEDLTLIYRFIDRGGNKVYDIMQELLSASACQDPMIDSTCIGELRLAPDRTVFSLEWTSKPPKRERTCEGTGTG